MVNRSAKVTDKIFNKLIFFQKKCNCYYYSISSPLLLPYISMHYRTIVCFFYILSFNSNYIVVAGKLR